MMANTKQKKAGVAGLKMTDLKITGLKRVRGKRGITRQQVCAMAMALSLAGCASQDGDGRERQMLQQAADYCESIGGEAYVQETSLGTGRYCRLPNGRVEQQWSLYQRERLDIE